MTPPPNLSAGTTAPYDDGREQQQNELRPTARERAVYSVRFSHQLGCPKRDIQTDEFACTCAVRTAWQKLKRLGVFGP